MASELLREAQEGLDELHPEAFGKASEALDLFRRGGDNFGVYDALRAMVSYHRQSALRDGRKPLEALKLAEDHLEDFRRSGDHCGEACMLLSLAEMNMDRRGPKKRLGALESCQRALSIFQEQRATKYEVMAQLILTNLYFKLEQPLKAQHTEAGGFRVPPLWLPNTAPTFRPTHVPRFTIKMNQSEEVMAARAKLAQKFDAVRTGGKGTTRRRKMVKHQANSADEKQLQAHLKRLGLNNIPGIEEVNMFTEDGGVLHFNTPKVQAAVGANTYVISGQPENKRLEELLPGIINQLGADNLMNLRRIAEGFKAAPEAPGGDDIPDIGENFEEVSKQ